ncbi:MULTISPECIES: HNH endonuclease family protein [unclassified Corynebacterium]|uniref:HNH endonuclease family protein n=1 Tax=unclassified Corynebacterium TaxID=2624378 RepID=UPI0029CA2CE6|nr:MULTISPECIES: HNH endonuclease family protein [unclassified Corynebacterium]
MTGYSREAFGQAWSDDVEVEGGHNGCDTRNDILRRDLAEVVLKPGTHGCVVASGVLHDPYSGRSIDFVRGVDTSRVVQIDHVVALADAWVKGAQQLDEVTRRNLANDPLNLMAVDGGLNAQKGAGDAATWLPPNVGFRCDYARRQVAVKQRYGLWVTQAEKDALRGLLAQC